MDIDHGMLKQMATFIWEPDYYFDWMTHDSNHYELNVKCFLQKNRNWMKFMEMTDALVILHANIITNNNICINIYRCE